MAVERRGGSGPLTVTLSGLDHELYGYRDGNHASGRKSSGWKLERSGGEVEVPMAEWMAP